MITASVNHRLGLEGARQRLLELFERKQIECAWEADGLVGVVQKALPLVGVAKARVTVREESVDVELLQAPAFPSPATIQRAMVDELSRVLA